MPPQLHRDNRPSPVSTLQKFHSVPGVRLLRSRFPTVSPAAPHQSALPLTAHPTPGKYRAHTPHPHQPLPHAGHDEHVPRTAAVPASCAAQPTHTAGRRNLLPRKVRLRYFYFPGSYDTASYRKEFFPSDPSCSLLFSFVLINSSARAGALFALSLGAHENQLLFLCADKLECPHWRALCTLVRGTRKPIAAFGSPCFSFVPLHYTSDVCPVKLLILYPLSPVLRFSRFP